MFHDCQKVALFVARKPLIMLHNYFSGNGSSTKEVTFVCLADFCECVINIRVRSQKEAANFLSEKLLFVTIFIILLLM